MNYDDFFVKVGVDYLASQKTPFADSSSVVVSIKMLKHSTLNPARFAIIVIGNSENHEVIGLYDHTTHITVMVDRKEYTKLPITELASIKEWIKN